MNLFMTGATGFVGRHLLPELVDAGHTVKCLVRPRSARKLPSDGRIVRVAGDIHSPVAFESAIRGCDAVIHLAGIISEVGRDTFRAVHAVGTGNIVNAMRKHGVRRIVHMSALGTRPGAASRYHRTKYDAEVIIRGGQLDYTIFRPSVIHGPDGEFLRLLKRFASLPLFPVPGRGTALLQPVYVEDIATLFLSALSMPETIGRGFNVGGPRLYTFPEMVNIVATALGHAPRRPVHVPMGVILAVASGLEVLCPLVGRAPAVNTDQLIMLEEDGVCDTKEVESTFKLSLADFPTTLRAYLGKAHRLA
jgi:NADH dehydrogenase